MQAIGTKLTMSNLIPIKLAEQAMANLEAENSRLKEQVERLDGFMKVVSNIWRDRNIGNGASLIFMNQLLLRYNEFKEKTAKEVQS